MKKFFATTLCCVMLLSASIVCAAVDGNKIALGRISLGMSESELIGACGQPTYKDGDDWTYSTFKVEVERGIVTEISTRSESLVTPDGVRVGQSAEVLNSAFGRADKIDNERDGIEYKYYSNDRMKKIEFKVRDGIIVKISCKFVD